MRTGGSLPLPPGRGRGGREAAGVGVLQYAGTKPQLPYRIPSLARPIMALAFSGVSMNSGPV